MPSIWDAAAISDKSVFSGWIIPALSEGPTSWGVSLTFALFKNALASTLLSELFDALLVLSTKNKFFSLIKLIILG